MGPPPPPLRPRNLLSLLPKPKCSCSEVEGRRKPPQLHAPPHRGLEARIWGICRAGAYDQNKAIWTASSGRDRPTGLPPQAFRRTPSPGKQAPQTTKLRARGL